MKRLLASIGALLVLIALLPGGAWALVHWGRLDLLTRLDMRAFLGHSDGGAVFLVLLTVIGWGAWLLLVASVLSEAARALSAGKIDWRPPGNAVFGPTAAVLVTCVAGLAAATGQSSEKAPAPVPDAAPIAAVVAHTGVDTAGGAIARVSDTDARWHTVAEGDDLWTLAEHYCGDGSQWRELLAANPTTVLSPLQPLSPGTLLEIPASWPTHPVGSATDGRSGNSARLLNATTPAPQTVIVQPGDSLWQLAQEHLADGALWPQIQRDNAELIVDPDLIMPGQELHLPSALPTVQPPPGGDLPASDAGMGSAAEQRTPAASPEGSADQADTSQSPADRLEPVPEGAAGAPQPGAETSGVEEASDPAQGVGDHEDEHSEVLATEDDVTGHVRSLVGPMGAVVAGALIAALELRRRWQRDHRPPGQRPPRPTARGAAALAAMSSIAAVPERPVGPTEDESELDGRPQEQPGNPGHGEGPAPVHLTTQPDPHPDGGLVVRLGDGPDGPVTLDLLPGGRFSIRADEGETVADLLASLAVQLLDRDGGSVGVRLPPGCAWLDHLDAPEVEVAASADALGVELAELVAARSTSMPTGVSVEALREDSDQGEFWQPVVFLFDTPCHADERVLARLGISVVCRAEDTEDALLTLDGQTGSMTGRSFNLELLAPPARRAIEELFEVATSTDYEPAWWWASPSGPSDAPTPLHTPPIPLPSEESTVPDSPPSPAPFLRMLGPIELVNADGPRPSRAVKQCEEYCAWILAHPGSSAGRMTRDLLVADATRRSNMSRLRAWLGRDPDGQLYLPDAYTGRIALHPGVSSDWEQLQVLIAGGVNRATDQALQAAMSLVRGAPLADAAPGEWRWAEELRTDMVCAVRDIGVALAEHCLLRHDLDQARWAASKALAAAPEDELLMGVRLRTEHLAGNRHEVERLVLHITRHARQMGVDLMDDTVRLLQEVMEGRARARLA